MINVTLVFVILFAIVLSSIGYKRGMAKQLTGLLAVIITACVLALLLMLISSFKRGEAQNTIYSLVLLIVLGSIYGIVKFVLRSVKILANLPVLSSLDKIAGIVVGFTQAVVFTWIFFLMIKHGFLEQYANQILIDVESSKLLNIIYENNVFLKMGM